MAKIPKLEYVASGCNYTRLPNPGAYELPDNLRFIEAVFRALQTIDGKDNHKFSLLYNAYTEKHFGVAFKKYYRPWLHTIHADSGGLQIITRGLQNTPETRGKVFENQAKFADIGMAFDEIPVKSTSASGTSAKIDTKRRYVDMENFESYARQTGLNVKDQIIKFDSLNSKCLSQYERLCKSA
jgi:hypothetical protein